MKRLTSIACLLLAVFLSSACVSSDRFEAATTDIDNQDAVIRKLRGEMQWLSQENARLVNENDLAKVELERLQGRDVAVQDVQALKAELASLRTSLSDVDDSIKVRQTDEGTALSVEGHVLFEPGNDTISPRGKDILRKIAERVLESGRDIRVEGHTDNVPVRKLRSRYPLGNLQLSGARSLGVADYLIRSCGLDRQRVSFAGYGSERAVADNGTDDGRRENRRVDILVLNERRD